MVCFLFFCDYAPSPAAPPPGIYYGAPSAIYPAPPPVYDTPFYSVPSVPDGMGGFVPITNSRVLPDGSLRPYDPVLDGPAYASPSDYEGRSAAPAPGWR
ncbi:hypothetical protein [Methylocapsa palsarum]|uniref:Uncharacterized protein n=1 Tax=Methylocapsa palsarum TaxID=1612308 RepID=A0A1I4AIA4_9HYPH|nr:hypothetical protein [Methylocapsa palsarum]SFK56158.1 hypothetical protein SAMN05444581_110122 [Methylocapsa palsarum]